MRGRHNWTSLELEILDKPLRLTETEKAYLAALVDGEGSIVIGSPYQKYSDGYKRYAPRIYVGIFNTNEVLMEWIKKTLSNEPRISFHYGVKNWGKSERRFGSKPVLEIKIFRATATYIFLKGILPYLVIKKDKAQEAIGIIEEQQPVLVARRLQRSILFTAKQTLTRMAVS